MEEKSVILNFFLKPTSIYSKMYAYMRDTEQFSSSGVLLPCTREMPCPKFDKDTRCTHSCSSFTPGDFRNKSMAVPFHVVCNSLFFIRGCAVWYLTGPRNKLQVDYAPNFAMAWCPLIECVSHHAGKYSTWHLWYHKFHHFTRKSRSTDLTLSQLDPAGTIIHCFSWWIYICPPLYI
jgi:hypothetical protein